MILAIRNAAACGLFDSLSELIHSLAGGKRPMKICGMIFLRFLIFNNIASIWIMYTR